MELKYEEQKLHSSKLGKNAKANMGASNRKGARDTSRSRASANKSKLILDESIINPEGNKSRKVIFSEDSILDRDEKEFLAQAAVAPKRT